MTPRHILILKGGRHAGAEWEEVARTKLHNLRDVGVTYWGYRGNACHPRNQVQPFAQRAPGPVEVVVIRTKGERPEDASTTRAEQWSADERDWRPLPRGIQVTGSKYALVLDELVACEEAIDLNHYVVGIGESTGTVASHYLSGQVSRGCFTWSDECAGVPADPREVVLRGRLAEPYAVFLKP